MTAPRNDGRPMIDRAREMARLDRYPFHERSSDGQDALIWLLDEYDRLAARDRHLAADLDDVNAQIEKVPGIDIAIKTVRYVMDVLKLETGTSSSGFQSTKDSK